MQLAVLALVGLFPLAAIAAPFDALSHVFGSGSFGHGGLATVGQAQSFASAGGNGASAVASAGPGFFAGKPFIGGQFSSASSSASFSTFNSGTPPMSQGFATGNVITGAHNALHESILNSGGLGLSSRSSSHNQFSAGAGGSVASTSGGFGSNFASASSFISDSASGSGAISSSQDSSLSHSSLTEKAKSEDNGAQVSVSNVESITVDKNANLNSGSVDLSSSSNSNNQVASAGGNVDGEGAVALTSGGSGFDFASTSSFSSETTSGSGAILSSQDSSATSFSSESTSGSGAISSSQDSSLSQSLLTGNANDHDHNEAQASVSKVESITVDNNANLNSGSEHRLSSSSDFNSQLASAGGSTGAGAAETLTSVGSKSYTGNPFFEGRLDSASSSSSLSSLDSASGSGAISSSQDSSLSQTFQTGNINTEDHNGKQVSVLKVESITVDNNANLNSESEHSLSSSRDFNSQLASAGGSTGAGAAEALTSVGSKSYTGNPFFGGRLDSASSSSSLSSLGSASSSGAISSSQESSLSQSSLTENANSAAMSSSQKSSVSQSLLTGSAHSGDYNGAQASVLNVESVTVDENANLNVLSSDSNLNSQFTSDASNTETGTAEALTSVESRPFTGNPFLGGQLESGSSSSSSSESASSSAMMSSQDSSVSQSYLTGSTLGGAQTSVLNVDAVTVADNANLNTGSVQGLSSSSNLNSQFASAGSNADVGTAGFLNSAGSGNPFLGGRSDSVSSSSSSFSSESASSSAMMSSQDSSVSQSYRTGSTLGGAQTSVLNVDASALAQQSGSQILGSGAIADEGYNQNQGSNKNAGHDSSRGKIVSYAQSGPVVHIVRAENDDSVHGSGSNQGSGITYADGAVASLGQVDNQFSQGIANSGSSVNGQLHGFASGNAAANLLANSQASAGGINKKNNRGGSFGKLANKISGLVRNSYTETQSTNGTGGSTEPVTFVSNHDLATLSD